jgi:hypothetical protein
MMSSSPLIEFIVDLLLRGGDAAGYLLVAVEFNKAYE